MSRLLMTSVYLIAAMTAPLRAAEGVKTFDSELPFDDVMGALEDAVVNRGYVIDYRGNVGEMLKRTAGDVGSQSELYADAEFIQFCSAVVSRQAMEADIANIAYCPYVLFAYETEETPGVVTVGYRTLPEGPGLDEVNSLLEEISQEAAEGF
jgi:uncharacterized protein (DUF302 family)